MFTFETKKNVKHKTVVLIIALMIALPVMPRAEEKVETALKDIEVAGNISMVTDYRWRGVSLSDENLAVQGGFSLSHKGFYTGLWSSNIDFADNVELDFYGGYSRPVTDFLNAGLELKYVMFPGFENGDFLRISPNISGQISKLSWELHFDYEPEQADTFRDAGDNSYTWVNASIPLNSQNIGVFSPFILRGRVGYEDGVAAEDKVDWLIDVSTSALGLTFSLGYVDTNKSADSSDAAALFSVSKSF